MGRSTLAITAFAWTLAASGTVFGQDSTSDELKKLKEQVERLQERVDGQEEKSPVDEALSRMHFHGYGEAHANFPETGAMTHREGNETDIHRFVLGWGYKFSDSIRLDAEVDFEHSATEIELEYAQLDFDLTPTLTLRVGNLLMPVGPLNEFHEPPLFYSVERPYVMNSIIPTTWQENGVGIVGRFFDEMVTVRAYLVTGLDAEGFTSKNGLRGGRSHGAESKADDFAFVTRVEHSPMTGLALGLSAYAGGADQDEPALGSVRVTMFTGDARYRRGNLDLRAFYGRTDVSNADEISVATGQTIGEVMDGWYLEAAYNVLPFIAPKSDHRVVTFIRREEFDTNAEVASGYDRNGAADRQVLTVGLAYYPIPEVVIKADYEWWRDESDGDDDSIGRVNLGVGFMF